MLNAKKKPDGVVIGWTPVEDIIPLRHRVLRQGMPIEAARFEGDDISHTRHVAAHLAGTEGGLSNPVCCASFMLNAYNEAPAWQLRGMATEAKLQGLGLGAQLLAWAERELRVHPGYPPRARMLWCNARESAVKFYEKNGWKLVPGVFDIPTAGPHYKMTKGL